MVIGAKKYVKETKQAATLLEEAMDRFQALFVETVRGKIGKAPPVSNDEFRRRAEDAHALRMRAAAIANRLEARMPQSDVASPKMRRSAFYPFYLASRRARARQFSAVDIMHLASNLLGAAEYEDDAELAAKTGEVANELGAHALVLLRAASTLRTDEASFLRMKFLFGSVEMYYQQAMDYHAQALAALNRLARFTETGNSAELDRAVALTEGRPLAARVGMALSTSAN